MSIIRLIQTDGQAGLEKLYDTFRKRLYFFVLKHTKDTFEAENLVHDIFVKIYEQRQNLKESIPAEKQVFRIAQNVVIDHYRKKLNQAENISRVARIFDVQEEDDTPQKERIKKLKAAIETLPPKRKKIFELNRFDGLTYKEIAEELSISPRTVEDHISKALKSLRNKLAQFLFF